MKGFNSNDCRRETSKMNKVLVMCFITVTLSKYADSEESLVRSVTLDKRLVDSEASDIFNKTLASKDGSKFVRGARTPPTPPTRVMPSYSPPSRAFFTPPLPREYLHPFADKPTLRGSNSDSVNVGNRRPIPPPPPFRIPPEDLIPIRPPDLAPHDAKKKTLNTPSFKKVADAGYSETSSTTTSNARVNETFDFVPILPYPSVSRILYGGSGRKHDVLQEKIERARLEQDKEPRTIKQEIMKALVPPVKQEEVSERKPVDPPKIVEEDIGVEETETKEAAVEVTDSPKENEEAQKQEVSEEEGVESQERPDTRHVVGIAWDIHVYLIATLFALLALCSVINIARILYHKNLMSRGYFIAVHSILFVIGCTRSFYLFYDAYNVGGSFPEPISGLLFNTVFPLITSAFAVLFLFLLTAADVKVLNKKLQKAPILAVLITLHLALNLSAHLYVDETPYSALLPLICQCVFIVVCVGLGLAYLYLYKSLAQGCSHKAGYAGDATAHAVRVTLATAMLSLLMAAVHLYGMLGVYEGGRPQPWLWWGFQLSVRVIEVSMCALLSWAGVRPEALPDQPASVDDMYPAICTANQAYTLRKHYDDTYPLNSLKQGVERRLQPSPSMLVAENGFVRFRTIADDDPYAPHA